MFLNMSNTKIPRWKPYPPIVIACKTREHKRSIQSVLYAPLVLSRLSIVTGGGMSALLASDCIALLAKLVKDAFVFTEVVHAPVSHGHHDAKVQNGAEHQHERDGQGEDQECVQQQLGYGHHTPDGGQDPVARA